MTLLSILTHAARSPTNSAIVHRLRAGTLSIITSRAPPSRQSHTKSPLISTLTTNDSISQSNIVADATAKYTIGQQICGFTVRQSQEIPELALHALFLEDAATGAEHLHITRADHNNVFGVGFRTPPTDSTGVAHILEHTVLCGSEKFPVRDPFFNMLHRSLSTFMNAMTSSDWTIYPFSTLNAKDYKNLMSVYLDAAFFPRLREMDFRQEGTRLEHEDLKDISSPIVFKGVVFNEMKGVFNNQENIFGRKIQNYLLPSGTYSIESGGDPLVIPSLTWEQLKSFHRANYHPSNARFFTYGDMPLEEHLDMIQGSVLKRFQRAKPNNAVNPEPRWTEPRAVTIEGPINQLAPPDKQTTVSVSYLLPEILDPFENFCMAVVGKLLISGPKAPFYKSLVQSGLGSDYSSGTGLDSSIREGIFAVGLKNVSETDAAKIEEIVHSTVDEVVKTGFDTERVEAILHEVELYLKHQSTSFGLHLFFNIMSPWTHDADPIQHMKHNEIVERFRQAVTQDPQFLQNKVKQYLQDNKHRLVLTMKPREDYEAGIKAKEDQLLALKLGEVDDARRKELFEQGNALAEEQSKKPDVSLLPTLTVSDIETSLPPVDIRRITYENTPIICITAPTNGVTYFRSLISTEKLDKELLPYLPLFCSIVTHMGAGEMDYRQLSQKVELKTGGLGVSEHASNHYSSTEKFEQGIVLSSYCLDRNIHDMFDLWAVVFNKLRLDDLEHFGELVKQTAAALASGLADHGHGYAMGHSAASIRSASKLKEQWNGISQVLLMKDVAESSDLTATLDKMRAIANHLLSNGRMRCSLNSTGATMNGALNELGEFLSGIASSTEDQHLVTDSLFFPKSLKTHLTFPFAVNYSSRCLPGPAFVEPAYASSRLLAKILSGKFLHREIREKGGAYGGGAKISHDGLFQFYSYRDPKTLETFDAFDRSIVWAANGSFTQQDLDEAKLSTFSEVDKPVAPGSQGAREFLFHVTDELYQAHRQRLLNASRDHLVEFAREYLQNPKYVASTILGPPSEEVQKDGWNVIAGAGEEAPKSPCQKGATA
ncbi:Presequence protease, mitochondrial [Hypsibius exemplaris]|uniref:Presequence protease, mitochondrial n=1 Tax=Hypsibius exemplaris TaxID=2072580 RepID=A0A9X6NCA0_HYPEX|nr:Presequence protease, mitochondrial [Hypsibius exemplaris]